MKTMYRLPERFLPGTYKAIIVAIDINEVTSKKGNRYEQIQVKLLVFYEQYGITMHAYNNIPFFWNEGGQLIKMVRAFDILPEIGEALHIESLIHTPVEIVVEETVYNSKVYSNVVDMVPLTSTLPVPLQDWLDQQGKTRQLTDTIFDDRDDTLVEKDSGNENVAVTEKEADENASAELAPLNQPFASPRQPAVKPIKRRPLSGPRPTSDIPIKRSQESNGELGDL